MDSIQTIISDLEFGRAQLLKSIEGMSERELTESPIYEGWTIKDVMAHIIGWDQWVLSTLPLLVQNRSEELPEVESDEYNEKAVEAWQDNSLAEILAEIKSTHLQIMEMISRLDHVEIDLRRQRQGLVITIRSYVIDMMVEHERKHAVEIKAWRKALNEAIEPETIKATLAQNRADFWAALGGLSEAKAQDKRAINSWSIQDVVGHLADWEQLMFKAARHIHDPSCPAVPVTSQNEEEWNETMRARRAGHAWQAELDHLRLIQAALDEFISQLKPGDWRLRGPYPWPNDQGTLAELIIHAAEHYADHLPDLIGQIKGE